GDRREGAGRGDAGWRCSRLRRRRPGGRRADGTSSSARRCARPAGSASTSVPSTSSPGARRPTSSAGSRCTSPTRKTASAACSATRSVPISASTWQCEVSRFERRAEPFNDRDREERSAKLMSTLTLTLKDGLIAPWTDWEQRYGQGRRLLE